MNSLNLLFKLNIFNDKKRLKMLILVFACQILFMFIVLFSFSSIMSTSNNLNSKYEINFETPYSVSNLRLDELNEKSDNYYTYLAKDLVARNQKTIYISLGRDIARRGEIVVDRDLGHSIGEEIVILDKTFVVVGLLDRGYSEVLFEDVPDDITIDTLYIINENLYSSRDKKNFVDTLSTMYDGATITEPTKVKFSELLSQNDYFSLILGILLLSFTTIVLTIFYTIGARKKNYTVFKLVGMSNRALYAYTFVESSISILVQSIIACIIYLIFDLTVNNFIQMNAYGAYYAISFFEYIVLVSTIWFVYVAVNMVSVARLKLKRLKEYL